MCDVCECAWAFSDRFVVWPVCMYLCLVDCSVSSVLRSFLFFFFSVVFDTMTVSACAPRALSWCAIVLQIDLSYLRGLSGGRSADG